MVTRFGIIVFLARNEIFTCFPEKSESEFSNCQVIEILFKNILTLNDFVIV